MGSMSIWHWLIVLAVVLLMFGAGRLPRVMGDFAKGIKAFKSGMKEGEETAAAPAPAPVNPAPAAAQAHAAPQAAQPHVAPVVDHSPVQPPRPQG